MRNSHSNIVGLPEGGGGEKWCIHGNDIFPFSLMPADMQGKGIGWGKLPRSGTTGSRTSTSYAPDLKEMMARCCEAGVPLHSEKPFAPGPGFGMSVEARDPDGNTVALTRKHAREEDF
jgi:predicted enzyme related to lactoylglutathione lyase